VLQLTWVEWNHYLDFSRFVKLDDLKVEYCEIYGSVIFSYC
jgi:hypothetical protein